MSNAQLSLESVKAEVDNLAALVHRSAKAVAETGQRVLRMEISDERKAISTIPNPLSGSSLREQAKSEANEGNGDAVGSEDLVELVTELQGQLDLLDMRSVRRSANSTKIADDEFIAALPGNDGLIPGESEISEEELEGSMLPDIKFPTTVGEFKKLSQKDVETWLRYYELLPPDEAELRELLGGAATTEAGKTAVEGAVSNDHLTEAEANSHFDTLARHLGLRPRRSKCAW